MEWAYPLCGLIVGFLVGLTGLGGGSLMTPMLVLLFGVPPATAVGTDLLYASITKAGGVWVHHRKGNVDWKLVAWLAAGSLPASILTTWALTLLDLGGKDVSLLISGVLGIALMLTALAILFRQRIAHLSRAREIASLPWGPKQLGFAAVVTGVVLGVFVTISSVGAGAIGMVALMWLYPRLPSVKLVGVDIAHAVPLTAVAGMGHFYMGSIDFTLLGSLLVGSLPGIYLGSQISGRIPDHVLRPVLACMLLVVGGRLVM